MRIQNNLQAVNALRNLSVTNYRMGKSAEKLSSGYRINRAGDDAAGLVISEILRSDVGGFKVAQRNALDGISLVQTAEGALNEVHSMLQRIRDLGVQAQGFAQATGGAPTGDAVAALQAEVDQLVAEIDRIGTDTEFAGVQLFAGAAIDFQVGTDNGQDISVTATALATVAATGTIDSATVTVDAAGFLAAVDGLIDSISSQRSELGAIQNRFEHAAATIGVSVENLTAAESRIRDVDMAEEMVNFTKYQILQQAGTAMLAQANAAPQSVLSLLR